MKIRFELIEQLIGTALYVELPKGKICLRQLIGRP